MGTYTTGEYLELFGGLPEPGEAAVDVDAVRDQADDWPWTLVGSTPAKASRDVPCAAICGPEGCMRRGCPVAR